jgi:TP901 family phage tail tape measure protein
MSEKRSVWELFLKDSVSNKLNPLNGAADKLSGKFSNLNDRINRTHGNLNELGNNIPGVGRGLEMLNSPMLAVGAGIAVVGAGMYKSAQLAMDFETGMAKINATAQLGDQPLSQLHDRIQEIASASGGNFEKVPEAYEKILSQTGKVNLSLDILETSVKGAKAGFTDIDVVAGALAQTLSVVGEQNTTASEVMDTLLKAKRVGAGEFKDFAQYMPQLVASANNMNISFKDTAGLFSYMTAKGQSSADAAMLMQNAFTALQKNDVIKGLGAKGIPLFNVDGSRKNVKDIFLDLSKKLSGLTDKQKTKFFIDIGLNDAQAKNAFSVLTSDAGKFKNIMEDVNNALGETDSQLESTANRARSWGDIGDQMKSWGVSIGEYLLPVIDALMQGIEGFGRDFVGMFTGETWKDQDAYAKMNADVEQYKKQQAADYAYRLTQQKFGDKMSFGAGTETNKFYDEAFQKFLNVAGGPSKNDIVKGEDGKEMKDVFGAKNGKGTEGKDSKLQSGIDSVSGGGKQTRNVIVTINKMVENINVHAATVKESSTEIKRIVEETMLRAVQGSELALGNG